MSAETLIGPVRTGRRDGSFFAEARVDGRDVWFESPDAALGPSAEAFGAALLLPALRRRRRLRLADPVSREWLSNVASLMAIWHDWWQYPVLPPAADAHAGSAGAAPGTVLCFTGGVDSLYSLRHHSPAPSQLAFVQGFDIPLDDGPRMRAWDSSFNAIGTATGTRPIRLRSNLRAHPLVRGSQWDRSHGGAVAAVGHLLTAEAGTLVIAASFPISYGYAWGSHLKTDPLWSSDRLRVVHHGAESSRIDKIFALVDDPLAQSHLRVCWENRAPVGNCSRCDKCVCTMAALAARGDALRFRTFDWTVAVPHLIDGLRATRFVRTYGDLLTRDPAPPVADAIQRLLKRSARSAWRRALWHRWRG